MKKLSLPFLKLMLFPLWFITIFNSHAQKDNYINKQVAVDNKVYDLYETPLEKPVYNTGTNNLLNVGDNCGDPIPVTINSNNVLKSLAGATFSGHWPPLATSPTITDVWFITQADANGYLEIDFYAEDYGFKDFGITVWSSCVPNPPISLLSTITAPAGNITSILFGPDKLSPNQDVYIQIWTNEPSTKAVIISPVSRCGPFFPATSVGAQVCNNETGTFSQAIDVTYYTIEEDPVYIQIEDELGNLIYSTLATSNPQTITIPNLPGNGLNQRYLLSLDVCPKNYWVEWEAPDCENTGNSCPETLTINHNSDLSIEEHRASETIITDGGVTISSSIAFKAGTSITLSPGFKTIQGVNFSAIIEDCPESSPFSNTIDSSSQSRTTLTTAIIIDNQISVYPNPFNQITTIDYQLAEPGQVTITLFDISGKKIRQLTNSYQNKGQYQLTLNAENIEAGLYFIHANLKGIVKVEKVYLVR